MSIDSRVNWLKFGAGLTVGSGVMIAAAALSPLAGLAAFLIDLAFYPVDGAPAMGDPVARLLAAIGGGVLVGWGVMLHLVATRVFAKDPALGRSLIMPAVACWFVIDSSLSVASGAPLNLVLNLGFLLVFVLPVWKLPADSQPAPIAGG